MIIAIDGPSGAGKSTVAKAVAKKLGFSCLDTGAMYRAVAWRALQDGADLADEEACGRIAREREVSFGHVAGDPVPRRVFIDGDEVTEAIRTAEIDRAVSPVSAHPAVREALTAQQQRIGRSGDYVVEGRDIGQIDVLCVLAADIGLNADEMRQALENRTYADDVKTAIQNTLDTYHPRGVPILFVNGQRIRLRAYTLAEMTDVLRGVIPAEENQEETGCSADGCRLNW